VDGAGWKESKFVYFPSFKGQTNAWLLGGGRQQIWQENCLVVVPEAGVRNGKTTAFLQLLKKIKSEIRALPFSVPSDSLFDFIEQILMSTG